MIEHETDNSGQPTPTSSVAKWLRLADSPSSLVMPKSVGTPDGTRDSGGGRGARLSVPPDHLYWGILTGLGVRPSETALRYAFESLLPAPIDEIEARFTAVRDGPTNNTAFLACGIERQSLEAWLDEAGTIPSSGPVEIDAVQPSGLPECIRSRLSAMGVSDATSEQLCQSLEFRSRTFESPKRQKHRRRTLGLILAAAAATMGLCSAALFIEAVRLERTAQVAKEAISTAIGEALAVRNSKSGGSGPAGTVDPALRLAAELRRLEQTRDRAAARVLADDRLSTLINLLAVWPEAIPTRVESLQLEQDSIVIRGLVREALDYEKLAAAVKDFDAKPDKRTSWTPPTGNASLAGPTIGYSFNLAMKRSDQPGTVPTQPKGGVQGGGQ